ncbi:MAG: PAS domain S-box protein [Gemmatimonadetes bacterium]|nr:PAS domain S-box protein [Gemmatimonadota bacterium]
MTQQEPSPAQDQPGAAVGPRPDRTDQLGDTEAHLHFLESLDRVQRVMHGANDLEQEIGDVLGEVLSIFGSDRAWLVYPCDPVSTTWRSVVERTVPAFPPALPSEVDIPMTPEVAADFLRARMTDGAICLGPNTEPPLDEGASRYGIRSQMTMALYPAADRPYVFGIHQCSEGRSWNAHEQRLFVEIGRRISDGLNRLLILRRLRASEGRLAEAQRIAHVGHWECDLVTGRVNWSDETYRIFGHEPGTIELTAAAWTDMIHPDDRARREDAVQAAIRTGAPYEVEYRLVHPSGALRTVACAGNVWAADDGTPLRTFGVIQDITDRRHVERELRRSEARFRVFADHATDAFFLHDSGGRILDANRQACESLGYSRDALVGQLPSIFDDEFHLLDLESLGRSLLSGQTICFDSRHRRRDGSTFPVEVRLRPFKESGLLHSVSLARDITDRMRAEMALRESHALLQSVIEGTSDAVFVKDVAGRYLMMNAAAARLLGCAPENATGKSDEELLPAGMDEAHRSRELDVMASAREQTYEHVVSLHGHSRTLLTTTGPYRDARGNVIGVVAISRDVTELKRMEGQLRQAQKMEAVGQLAGGVAHDFNNLLTVINGYSNLLLNQLEPGDPDRDLIAEIRHAGERAETLTRQLLAFSRKQVLQPQVVRLNAVLEDLHKLLRRLIGEDVDIVLSLDPDLGLTKVDPAQFEQAIINIAVNARDAMPGGGRLRIDTGNAELDDAYAAEFPGVRPGRYLRITLRDSGVGMDATTSARVFEPFFTTKVQGKGTGLGLAMVYGFVTQSGGHIEVQSEPGNGTAFHVYLPRDDSTVPSHRPPVEQPEMPRGAEVVLIAEDEGSVRSLSRMILSSCGYTVLEASDGEKATVVARQHPGKIDLLVTDVVMPRMSGPRLAELLTADRPGMRVLLLSGYSGEAVTRHGTLAPETAFLQKPFGPMELARKVREVLDAPPSAKNAAGP